MKQILPHIFVIEVPKDLAHFTKVKISALNYICYKVDGDWWPDVTLPLELRGNVKILGTITPTEIDFDCEPLVERHSLYDSYFKDYNNTDLDNFDDYYKYAKGSMWSAIEAAGITEYEKLVVLTNKLK